jgi:pyridoxine/pyridoxamine 5'-phosphate oxidase
MNPVIPNHYDDLDAVREEIRTRLVRGVRDRHSAFHLMSLASSDESGSPRLRTVVLRGVCHDLSELSFHTDARSAKCRELSVHPACAMLFYDPRGHIQVRLEGRAQLHREDTVALAAWEKSTPQARQCYAIEPGPGTPIDDPRTAHFAADQLQLRERFVRVAVAIERIEWLYLRAEGHRRAAFANDGGRFTAHWLVP